MIHDATVESCWRQWTINTLVRSMEGFKSIRYFPKNFRFQGYKKILICGAGPSLAKIENLDVEDALIVANQSSLFWLEDHDLAADIIVISDGNDAAGRKLITNLEATHTGAPIIAGLHTSRLLLEVEDVYYIPMYLGTNGPFNAVTRACVSDDDPFVMQLGSVIGASLAIMNVLHALGIIEKIPMVLVGVDLSYGKAGEKPMAHINEESDRTDLFEKDGEIVDHVFVEYEKQIEIVSKQTILPMFVYNEGSRLERFLPRWKA